MEDLKNRTNRIINQYGIKAQERFSQNFLIDESRKNKIISTIPFKSLEEIVEIGCGLGSLTASLVKSGVHVTGIEFDNDMIRVLKEEINQSNFTLIQGDFLVQDLSLFHVKQIGYIGNLPYSISRQILKKLLIEAKFSYFGFMVQKELGEKLIYKEGDSQTNIYSLMFALRGKLEKVIDLNPGCFYPAPKVDSSFLVFIPDRDNDIYTSKEVFDFLTVLFKNAKKNINNNLRDTKYAYVLDKLESKGISKTKRPFELSLENIKLIISIIGINN